MTLDEFLYARLAGASALTALVGTRITAEVMAQGAGVPAVTYTRTGGGREYTQDGPEELAESSWQFDSWAATRAESLAVSRAVYEALGPGDAAAGYDFTVTDERYDYEQETRLRRVMLEARIWFKHVE